MLFSLTAVASASVASAAPPEPDRASPPSREAPPPPERDIQPIRIGAIGGIGFPRPLAVEALAKIEDRVALGVEYGTMPTVTVAQVDATTWSLAGDARLFPFRSPIFVGLRAGHQHIGAETTLARIGLPNQRAELTVDSWYLNPRLGILWTSRIGVTIGTEAGLQIPVTSTVSTNIPPIVPQAQTAVDIANGLGRRVIPSVDLLRVGLLL